MPGQPPEQLQGRDGAWPAATPEATPRPQEPADSGRWPAIFGLIAAYFAAGWWGVEVATQDTNGITMAWPASGVALAAVLRYGFRVLPLVSLTSAALNLPPVAAATAISPGAWTASAALAGVGGALEPALTALVSRRLAGIRTGAVPYLLITLVAMPIGAAAGAMLITGSLSVVQPGIATDTGSLLMAWHGVALSNYIGMVVVTPALWFWLTDKPAPIAPARLLEAVAYLAVAGLALAIREPVQLIYLLLIAHIALVVRVPLRWASVAMVATSLTVLWLTAIGAGPIPRPTPYQSFLATLTFLFALNVVSYLIGLLWRDLDQHSRHLEDLVSRRTRELEETNARLERLSRTDPLTGAWNRRHFDEVLRRECERAIRNGSSLCLVALDLDHFKQVNDEHGHDTGDAVLKTVVERMTTRLRPQDTLGRTGGEEFNVLTVDRNRAGGVAVAERLHAAVAEAPIEGPRGPIEVRVSAGVVEWCPADYEGKSAEEISRIAQRLADRRLYVAKRDGRDRIEASAETVD